MNDPTDLLSRSARHLLSIDRDSAYRELVPRGSRGSPEARDLLESLRPDQLLASGEVRREEDARALLAALWLWHDCLDESHALSQNLNGESGSFWHAIMHRREGDFSNSKYWYARCDRHPVLATLNAQASAIVNPLPADKSILRLTAQGWNPAAFVDLVEAVHLRPDDPRQGVAVALQRLEWRVLFEHCTRGAAGA